MELASQANLSQSGDWSGQHGARLEAAVQAARRAAEVPAYAAAWRATHPGSADIGPETWHDLPFLTKDELIESAALNPPFGNRLAVAPGELANVFVAPGPLYMPFTDADMDMVAGSFARAFDACGLQAGDLVDQTTMYNWVIAATVMDRALRKLGCCVVPGGVGQSERHLEVIEALGVNAIVAFPTFLEHLLQMAEDRGRALPLRTAVVMGELSRAGAKQAIRERYGLEVREFYGVADVGALAWECQACDGMHLREDVLVEFVTPGGSEPIEPAADTPAELVVTDFHRQAMPIIRLRTGDVIDGLTHEPCACGRTAPRFRRIAGRASEITKVKGMFVVPRQVGDRLREAGIDSPFRLVVTRHDGARDELALEIQGEALPGAEALRESIQSALRLSLDLKFVDAIPDEGPRLVDLRMQGDGA